MEMKQHGSHTFHLPLTLTVLGPRSVFDYGATF